MIKQIIIFLFSLVLFGCNNTDDAIDQAADLKSLPIGSKEKITFDEPEKIVSFVDDNANGFIKSKKFGQVNYTAILKPTDYLLAQKKISDQNNNYKKTDFEDLQYFDLRIKIDDFKMEFIKYNLSSPAQYDERVSYCAFNMQNDIKLIDGKDTLNCVMYHFERAFDVIPYGHFILGFENKSKKSIDAKTLCFDDKLFNNGIIKFTYSPSFLAKEPTLL